MFTEKLGLKPRRSTTAFYDEFFHVSTYLTYTRHDSIKQEVKQCLFLSLKLMGSQRSLQQ
jgi:hypothetical protein